MDFSVLEGRHSKLLYRGFLPLPLIRDTQHRSFTAEMPGAILKFLWSRKSLGHLLTHPSVCVHDGWGGRAEVHQGSSHGDLVGVGFVPIMVSFEEGTHLVGGAGSHSLKPPAG